MKTQHLSVLLLMVVLLFGCHAESNKNTSIEKDSVGVESLNLRNSIGNRSLTPKVKTYLDKFIDKYGKSISIFEIWVSDIDQFNKAIIFTSGYTDCMFEPAHYVYYRGKVVLIYSSIDFIFRKENTFNNGSKIRSRPWCIVYSCNIDEDNNWIDNIVYFDSTSSRIPYEKFRHEIKFEPE